MASLNNDVMADLMAPFTPDQCERETVRSMNQSNRVCASGHPMTYSHAVGGYRCEFGSLHRANGAEIRPCNS